jgi:hypothetical protein
VPRHYVEPPAERRPRADAGDLFVAGHWRGLSAAAR